MWNTEQINILKEFYPKGGYETVKNKLPYSNRQVRSKAIALKIKIINNSKKLKLITKNLKGEKYDKWEVLEFFGYTNGNAQWICRCECGLEKPVKAMFLLSNKSRSCAKCCNPRENYIGEIAPKVWNSIVKRAKNRNKEISITKKYAYELFLKQNKLCALSGVEIYIPANASEYIERKGTASIDRIDSKKGYIVDNIQWVHKDINIMKNAFAQDYFVQICNLVTNHLSAKSSSDGPVLIP